MKIQINKIIAQILAILIAVIWILPLIGIAMVAIRPIREVLDGWWNFSDFNPTTENFQVAISSPTTNLGRGLLNSMLVASFATIIPILIAALAAYSFARFNFRFKTYLFILIVALMAIPQVMVAIPLFRIMNTIGLLDTYSGLILAHSAWGLPWIILFLRNFFLTLPNEVEEAGRIDGATDLQIFRKIVLPMTLPALLSVTALQFTWVWSDFFLALLLLFTPEKFVVVQRLVWMKGQFQTPWDLMTAGALIVMVIPVLVYVLLQKYYVQGMVGWGVGKG